jgi:hypothetical protein
MNVDDDQRNPRILLLGVEERNSPPNFPLLLAPYAVAYMPPREPMMVRWPVTGLVLQKKIVPWVCWV